MDTSDVASNAPAGATRYSAHVFDIDTRTLGVNHSDDALLYSGAPLRASEANWPPDILFDAIYASAVVCHFVTEELREALRLWSPAFYPGGQKTSAQLDLDAIHAQRDTSIKRAREQASERNVRYEDRNARYGDRVIANIDALMIMPYLMFPPEQALAMLKKSKEKAEAAERQQLNKNINSWLKGIPSA